jgi:pimeloyl-ACP methyl ester carboxylesterase
MHTRLRRRLVSELEGDVERGYADTPMGQVHYREMGSGEPVLLLHQTASSSDMFTELMPYLANDYRVIAMDTLGFGDSDQPDEPPGVEGYARNIAQFLDALGIEKAYVIGHHTGAAFASEFASTYPDRVIKLVLSGQPDYDPEVRPQKIAGIQPADVQADGSHLEKAWQRSAPGMKRWATPEQIHRAVVDNLKAGPKYYFAYLAVFNQDVRTRIPKIAAPTLLVSGENDVFVERQEQLKPMFKSAETYVFKDTGAITMQEKPEEFAKLVTDFFKK